MRQIKNTRMNREHKKYFLVGSLCIAIFLMLGIGYAVLSQQLDINGTAQITSNWEILFTSAEEKEMTNATTKRKEITANTTLTLDVQLDQPGASATYDVVVENQGDLDAVLANIEGVDENNNQEPKSIKVKLGNIRIGDALLASESKTFQVQVYWDASVDFSETDMQKEIEITLTYEQSDDGVPVGPIPGDGVDMGGQNVELVTSEDGLYEDQYEIGRYIYRGSEPNNYIQFNNELWRIVAKETDGTYKIIRDELLSEVMVFDEEENRKNKNNTFCSSQSFPSCGVFAAVSGTYQTPNGNYSGTVTEDSSIKEYLNDTYYPSLTGIAKTQVQSHTFNIGVIQESSTLEGDSMEKNIAGEKMYTWTGNVGLINATDVLRASKNNRCQSYTEAIAANPQNSETLCNQNYLLDSIVQNSTNPYWTINAYAREDSSDSIGNVVLATAGYVSTPDEEELILLAYLTDDDASYTYGVRPVVFLKSSIQFTEGNGSKSNPYIVQ